MTRRFPLRARGGREISGGRGPQIGDGTFEGRSGADATKPAQFTVIAWCPAAFPSIELWCYRHANDVQVQGGAITQAGETYKKITVTQVAPDYYLWLDKANENEEFEPAAGEAPDSPNTLQKLRQYASDRYNSHAFHEGVDKASNWTVTIARPFQLQGIAGDEDYKIESDQLYTVRQNDPGNGSEFLTSWVWVPRDQYLPKLPLGREIWLHDDTVGGFTAVGQTLPATGQVYTRARLHFKRWHTDEFKQWTLDAYSAAISQFKTLALNDSDGSVTSENELIVVDYRVSNPQAAPSS